jgi:dTDP-4-dehydrorhamnose 3,5-epimerase
MKITASKLQDCFLIDFGIYKDKRGTFNKLYHHDLLKEHNINIDIKEQFYTVSTKNVLRGMHFQLPPYDHDKVVSCLTGKVLDVVLDLRKNSDTYKQFYVFNLSQNDGNVVYIPSGMAHGFLSLEDNTGMLYNTSTIHAPEADSGIFWNSFGFTWPIDNPIISERDQKHQTLNKFQSPF